MKKITVKCELIEEMLGIVPGNKKIHEEFIASKSGDADKLKEELEDMPADELVMRDKCIFPRDDDGDPFLWDYQIKGFFKDQVGFLRRVPNTACSKVKAYKKEIDGMLFVFPRKVKINAAGPIGDCQRSLLAQTMQGTRNTLANSETVPEGSTLEFEILILNDNMEGWVKECLEYGRVHGFGQWRNSGKGKFEWMELKNEEVKP